MIKLYHGSNVEIEKIDLTKSRPFKDFGKAFYLSANEQQAWERAYAAITLWGGNPSVTPFEFDEQLMFDVPKANFMRNGKFDSTHIYEGNIIPLQGEDGSRFNGVVIEVKDDAVTIDLNHPRAGQDLHFIGTVVTHREATNEEVTQMINALSGGGCCGGGCGDCGGGCGSGEGGGCCGEEGGCGSCCNS